MNGVAARPEDHLAEAGALARRGALGAAEQVLRRGLTAFPMDRALFIRYALLQREADRRDDSIRILDHLIARQGADDELRQLRALIDQERGGDARCAYAALLRSRPGDAAIVRGAASAHWAFGEGDAALALLSTRLRTHPRWREGLQLGARILWESGDREGCRRWFEQGRRESLEASLVHAGFLASGQQFEAALEVARGARTRFGASPMLDMIEAQALAEIGADAEAEAAFDRIGPITDPGFVPIRMRSLLRTGRVEAAAALGEAFLDGAAAPFVWPLLALAWQADGDPRAHWLTQPDRLVATFDLGLTPGELDGLARKLRQLHISRGHPHDQSARGGTQTHGNLFDRTDPEIVRLRTAVVAAIREYIDSLPPREERHPFLGAPRHAFRFAGSWSIRLDGGGFHLAHVHPLGWISSALHVVVPDEPAEAGWLVAGGAPPELSLDLPPALKIRPRAGHLILFPSLMWHGTQPFREGERLTVAFDVAPYAEQ